MDYHHVLEAAGVVSLGLVVYSYLVRWFESERGALRRWRPVFTGVLFGGVTVVLMISRIRVGGDHFVDARAVPIALVGLIESTPAGAIAALVAAAYRIWLGGSGTPAGLLGIAAVLAASVVVRQWAKRDRRIGFRHALVLAVSVWAVTAGSFLVLGARGVAMFAPVWLPLLAMIVVGVVAGARLFGDVVAGQAAETARRESAQLRSVTSLARMAAHEINNPLTAVIGGLALIDRVTPPGSDPAKWIANAKQGAEQIRDIVKRMNRITQIEEVESAGSLPPMLDIRKSSAPS